MEHQRRQRGVGQTQHAADEQHVVADVLVSNGAPPVPSCHTPSANLSGALLAKRRDSSIWSSASTLTAKWPAPTNAARLGLARRSDHSTSGGSSDSALNELQVRPTGAPGVSRQVTIVTPVAKRPSAVRSSRVPGDGVAGAGVGRLIATADRSAPRSQALVAVMPQRASAASSATRASTQRAPCGVCSFFQNGACVFR